MSIAYSQRKACAAITIAALRSIAKSPSSVIFTIAFPLIFILVFGFIGGGSKSAVKLALVENSDSANAVLQQLEKEGKIKILTFKNETDLNEKLSKGQISVLLSIKKEENEKLIYNITAAPGAQGEAQQLQLLLKENILNNNAELKAGMAQLIEVNETTIQSKEFKSVDFILPGQLGFSLLAASVFGTAFVFFNLRQGLVLKRFFATPVKKQYILLGEGIARMIFQLMGALLIIFIGRFFLGYTLIHGFVTVINMLLLCMIGILVFMSFGFIISGIAKSEATVPPLANILTLPQFLLAGTFFPIESFPTWMQPISRALPLTYLNDALRAVAFEGASLWAVRMDIAILLLWGFIGYFVASKLFKWE